MIRRLIFKFRRGRANRMAPTILPPPSLAERLWIYEAGR